MNANPTNAQKSVRDKLRTALLRAMRNRDIPAVSALRSVLGALDNAESTGIPPHPGPARSRPPGVGSGVPMSAAGS